MGALIYNFDPRKVAFNSRLKELIVTRSICFLTLLGIDLLDYMDEGMPFWSVLLSLIIADGVYWACVIYAESKESCRVEGNIVTLRASYAYLYRTYSFAIKDIQQIRHKKQIRISGKWDVSMITYRKPNGRLKTIRYTFHEPKKFDDLIRKKNPTCLFV